MMPGDAIHCGRGHPRIYGTLGIQDSVNSFRFTIQIHLYLKRQKSSKILSYTTNYY